MKGLITFAVTAGLFTTSTNALHLQKRTDGAPRTVGFPVQRKPISDPLSRDRLRRRATVQASLDNEATLYFANATLGTPPQEVRLHIDTGSSDLWVNSPDSTLCQSRDDPCTLTGAYIANSSSTYSYIASDFAISYVDGSGASGDYVSDTFTIGGTTLPKLQFGIGYLSSSGEGILGIGYEANEVQVGRAGKAAYNNLPAQLVANNEIQSNAYSLWLNDLDASTGSILFGGVDTSKYHGQLNTLPIQRRSGVFAEFLVTLTGLSLGSTAIGTNIAAAVLLDSGSSLTYLPNDLTEAIYGMVDAQYDSSQGAAFVPCSLATDSTTLDFTFSSPTITVGMDELVIPISTGTDEGLIFDDGTPACLFGIAPAGSGTSVLGDTFIRSAYVVFDLSNNEISIAQTKFNATESSIVEIGTGTAAVPDATPVVDPVPASGAVGDDRDAGTGTPGVGSPAANAGAESTSPPMRLSLMVALGTGALYAVM